ncbi:hypothetical protein [Ewingella americana]|uniref:Uncharacterized protein n=1 Tax=Ewingella americana TaxID=41202 RepID=A0A502GGQ0_9GAMM|nr:hypothetical protein [Ewingella americana]TPG59903.1 hypothetical protein EAH77_15160 [Ewingella americana]
MERVLRLTPESIPKKSIIHFADGDSAIVQGSRVELDTTFIIAKHYEKKHEVEINIDQLLPFGNAFYAFDSEDLSKIPYGFIVSFLTSLLTDPSDMDVQLANRIRAFLNASLIPAAMGKLSDLKGKVQVGDILYYVEDGMAYPTIVRSIKNNVAKTLYMYDSLKISDCDEYSLDINDGEIRHIRTREYPSIRHVIAEVSHLCTSNISGKIRPFIDEDIAAQMIDSLIKG